MASAASVQTVVEDIDQYLQVGMSVFDSYGDGVGTVTTYSSDDGYLTVNPGTTGGQSLYVPFRLIRNIDPREVYLTVSSDTLAAQYTRPPTGSTGSTGTSSTGSSGAPSSGSASSGTSGSSSAGSSSTGSSSTGSTTGNNSGAFLSSAAVSRYITNAVLAGYAATLVSGFDTYLKSAQALPLYVYFSVGLLLLPLVIAPGRSAVQVLYTFVFTAFFEVYAGTVVFDQSTTGWTHSAYTYILLEGVLLAVFLADAIFRSLSNVGSGRSSSGSTATSPLASLSADVAGLAVFLYICALLLDLLGEQHVLQWLGIVRHAQPYVIVNLNAALGFNLPSPLNNLESLDLALAVGASAVALLLFALVGDLRLVSVPVSSPGTASTYATTSGSLAARIIQSVASEVDQVLLSIRAAVSPLGWLVPAFCAGALAQNIVGYLNYSAKKPGTIGDLFDPFSQVGLSTLHSAVGDVALAAVAVVAATLTIDLEIHDWSAAKRMAQLVAATGRALPLTTTLFLYSLAAFNAVLMLFVPSTPLPFRVGTLGLLALIVGASFLAGLAVAATSSGATASSVSAASMAVRSPQVRSRAAVSARR